MNDDIALRAALAIGKRLSRDAIWDQDRCNWLGPVNDRFMGTMLSGYGALGPSIYDGTAGIALFLAHLGQISGDPIIKKTALGAINHAVDRYQDCAPTVSLSFYTGHVGVGYAAIEIGHALDRPTFITKGVDILTEVLATDTKDKCILDVMLGVSASIPAIISVQDTLGRDAIKGPLLHWGEQIIASAHENDAGLSWDTTAEMQVNADGADWMQAGEMRKPNLLGYGHGASGIGLALLELGVAFNESKFTNAAYRAFDYESHWFDQTRNCWPDLRYHGDQDAKGVTEVAWCHGASGIGLARQRAHVLTGDARFLTEAQTAYALTERAMQSRLRPETNMCLCHGVCGDVELFVNAHHCGRAQLVRATQELIGKTFIDEDRPIAYGGGNQHQPPSLMLGLAGTGYAMLRTLSQDRPKSLLCIGTP
ncbi:lanthionine synthetase LanC family protein [Loktanella sp. S4079]|uniref:lanthionine synthetase LanC family protein n=1 Tax=Loktanella sp. S4079 TaxID=579483 RepID=UPI0005F9ADB1|nr:lanthionine synthetase LanC family protein [Loktanella sp. S4079]KJZ17863.1 hypothetical protein TW80_16620 [Loktanella sp. S4079]